MKISDVFLYLVIGGVFAGLVDRDHVEKCGIHTNFNDAMIVAIVWPAALTAAMLTKKTGEPICQDNR